MDETNSPDEIPWFTWLILHLGQGERTGAPPTDFDRMCFTHTNFGDLGNVMEPGCAATACAALELTGYRSPHSAAALSFESYGTPSPMKRGAICVFDFGGGDHHVSFFDQVCPDGKTAIFLGGNQGHFLQRATYPIADVIATRWPVPA